MTGAREVSDRFDCFGSSCAVVVAGDDDKRSASEAVELARRSLEEWHRQFSRFLPDSELSRLNRDTRRETPASALMVRLAVAVRDAAVLTDGLVDATLIDQLEHAGYAADLGEPVALDEALALAPPRRPAAARSPASWRRLQVDLDRLTVTRPPDVKLDSGGLVKGMLADVLAQRLSGHASFAVDCAGDLAIGGAAAIGRPIHVASPFDGSTLHTFQCSRTGVATSGIGRRSWLDAHGRPAHHLLDPASGRPAFTGVVQATALAPSALLAEVRAKAAVLSGPRRAPAWLPDGGVLVFDDGSHSVVAAPSEVTLGQLAAFVRPPATRGSAGGELTDAA
jgi:thiamine biosynthesis lipoprotein